jgi:predicted O-methyltransferase YrrM
MNAVLEELYAAKQVVSRGGKVLSLFPDAIERHKGASLSAWVRRARPRVTLEVGLAFGASALAVCQALEENGEGHHHAMDPYQRSHYDAAGLEHLEAAGLSHRLTFYEAPSYLQLPKLVEQGLKVDFAFVDGQHLFDYVLTDAFFIDLLLPVGGVMAFDDVWMGSVRKVIKFLMTNRGYRLVHVHNRFLLAGVAPGVVRALAAGFIVLGGGGRWIQPAFRFGALAYLEKTREDDRPWHRYREF